MAKIASWGCIVNAKPTAHDSGPAIARARARAAAKGKLLEGPPQKLVEGDAAFRAALDAGRNQFGYIDVTGLTKAMSLVAPNSRLNGRQRQALCGAMNAAQRGIKGLEPTAYGLAQALLHKDLTAAEAGAQMGLRARP